MRLVMLSALLLGGCITVPVAPKGTTRTYVGLVRVVMPDRKGDLAAIDVAGLGVGWDQGPWLGWRAGNWVSADPAKCQLLIVIRSPAQADHAAKMLAELKGQDLCVADFTRSLSR
jgi:hypothetical protein